MIALAWMQDAPAAAPAAQLPPGMLHAGALWSVIVPAALFVFTAVATWLLYRKFERQETAGGAGQGESAEG